jgi:hypothetical protein
MPAPLIYFSQKYTKHVSIKEVCNCYSVLRFNRRKWHINGWYNVPLNFIFVAEHEPRTHAQTVAATEAFTEVVATADSTDEAAAGAYYQPGRKDKGRNGGEPGAGIQL